MTSTLEVLFWASVGIVAYVYVAYPLIVWLLSRTVSDPALRVTRSLSKRMLSRYARFTKFGQTEPVWPKVSVIIAAYKEEDVIMQRLHNAVMTDYPGDKLEIIVGVDGDEDGTGELVATFDDSRVRLLQFPRRRGKASVLNDCVPQARGEIVIFSDANTMFDPQAIRRLVRHFQDDRVGGVCGKLVLVDGITGNNADGMYWRYENFMKRAEGRLGVLLGFNGAIYAIRRELYKPIPPQTIIDDFLIGMRIHLAGQEVIYDESALAVEETAPHVQAEFHRRARIGAGGFQSLMWLAPLLSPHRGTLAWAFWSHKVLRWMCPMFLAVAAIGNVLLISNPLYARLLLVQELFYGTAIFGLFFSDGRRFQRYLKIQALFVSVNAALFVGFFRWYRGIKNGTWKRTERVAAEPQPVAANTAPVVEQRTEASKPQAAAAESRLKTKTTSPATVVAAARKTPATIDKKPSDSAPTAKPRVPDVAATKPAVAKPIDKPSEEPQVITPAAAKPADVESTHVKPADVKPTDVKPAENTPAPVRPVEVKTADGKITEVKRADVTSPVVQTTAESSIAAPTKDKPASAKPAAAPAPVKAVDITPADVKPVDVKPAEARPSEAQSTDVKQSDAESPVVPSVVATPPEHKPSNAAPENAKPADAKPRDQVRSVPPAAKKAAPEKPSVTKPAAIKPAAVAPAAPSKPSAKKPVVAPSTPTTLAPTSPVAAPRVVQKPAVEKSAEPQPPRAPRRSLGKTIAAASQTTCAFVAAFCRGCTNAIRSIRLPRPQWPAIAMRALGRSISAVFVGVRTACRSAGNFFVQLPKRLPNPARPCAALWRGVLCACKFVVKLVAYPVLGCVYLIFGIVKLFIRCLLWCGLALFTRKPRPYRVAAPEPVVVTEAPEVIEHRKQEELSKMAEYMLLEVNR